MIIEEPPDDDYNYDTLCIILQNTLKDFAS